MSKVDPTDFLLNTDYEIDKIIMVKTGSFVHTTEFPHGLSFTPLIFGVWSLDPNFTSGNTIGYLPSEGVIPGLYTPPIGVTARAFSDKVLLETNKGENYTTTTVYYRIYAFPPNDAINAPTTSKLAKEFMLNTDYNYRKLKATGEFTQENESFTHGLGYIPQVMAWVKYADLPSLPNYSNSIEPLVYASNATNFKLTVTNNKIQIGTNPLGLTDKIIWRIYYDEA